ADIACFDSHHLNHLTPNTFCMDLYTAAMRFCMGDMDEPGFRAHARMAIDALIQGTDRHAMALLFRHLSADRIASFDPGEVSAEDADAAVDALVARLSEPDLRLGGLDHSGFKDYTEGPATGVPVLLRQDAYKALTEPVTFRNLDGSTVETVHTARFGEIEQRFYATTPEGRALYDECLRTADANKAQHPSMVADDFPGYQRMQREAYARFPGSLDELLARGLVYGRYTPTHLGTEAARDGRVFETTDIQSLVGQGFVHVEGLRYEDFLPFSAAGIFASNLDQYGTDTMAGQKPAYTQRDLEEIMGRRIVDPNTVYSGLEARSLLDTYGSLGILERIGEQAHRSLESRAEACRVVLDAGCAV
ncbi:MAG: DUF1338 family protein, partial [Planctomycetota bacterium]